MNIVRRLAKLAAITLSALIVFIAIGYSILVFINRNDREPSQAATDMAETLASRGEVDDAGNAFLMMLGFSATPEADALAMGMKRRDWMHSNPHESADPLSIDYEPREARSESINELADQCNQPGPECARALKDNARLVDDWLRSERWLYERYRRLISMPGFRETVPYHVWAPAPPYHVVLEGQRLLFLEAMSLARRGDTDRVRDLLRDDLVFWRFVLRDSGILMTKMIATAAITRHLKFGNLVLREFPPDQAADALPDAWLEPISMAERSMQFVFAGEWAFTEASMQLLIECRTGQIGRLGMCRETDDDGESAWERLQWKLGKPLWQPQDSSNRYAATLAGVADLFDVDFDAIPRSLAAAEELIHAESESFLSAYNPVGEIMLSLSAAWIPSYAIRVADLEGIRRASVLMADLRAASVPIPEMPAAIKSSTLRNPYDSASFQWDDDGRAIVFVGLQDDTRSMHRIHH